MEQAGKIPSIIPFSPMKSTQQWFEANAARHLHNAGASKSNSLFNSVWDNASDGLRLCDAQGLIIAVNRAFCKMFGKTEAEILGRPFADLYGAEVDTKSLNDEFRAMFLTEEIKPRFYRSYHLWSGKQVEAEVTSTYVTDDSNNKYMLTQFRDVTKERKSQRLLEDNEKRFHNLFTFSPLAMFQITTTGKIVNANKSFVRLMGFDSFYEILDVDVLHMAGAGNQEGQMLLQTLSERGYVVRLEIQLTRKNGRSISALLTARAVPDADGNVSEYEGVIEDITSRKHVERKLQEYVWALEKSKNDLSDLNAQKDKLFSILSHDLRSPFSSILGFCDILIKENKELSEEERTQFISYIQESAQDQLALVNNLLDWSRLESGRIKMETKALDLQDVADKCVRSLLGLARQKKVNLSSSLPAGTMMRGDQTLLSEVFGNLISNSLKFTPEGGSISIELIDQTENQWIVGVRDTGIGIPEEDIQKLFKVEEKYTRKGINGEKGTGLGLPVVYEIMQKHHGTIRVQSTIGTGTLFLLTFPKSCTYDSPTILIVDDEQGMRLVHSRYIERAMPKVKILYAMNGNEAYQITRESHPAMIVSDCDMPEVDGHDFVKKVREDPEIKDIPIVIITGQNSNSNREVLKSLGVNEILTKPVSPEKLEEVIKRYVSG
jgi:PAS domain S-box-containing protein